MEDGPIDDLSGDGSAAGGVEVVFDLVDEDPPGGMPPSGEETPAVEAVVVKDVEGNALLGEEGQQTGMEADDTEQPEGLDVLDRQGRLRTVGGDEVDRMGLSADASVSKDVVILSHRRPMASLRKWIQATYPVGGLAGTQSPGSVSGPRRRFGTRYRVPGARYPVPGTSTPFPLSCRTAELPHCPIALSPWTGLWSGTSSPAEREVGASAAEGHEVDPGRRRPRLDVPNVLKPLEDPRFVVRRQDDPLLTFLSGKGQEALHDESPPLQIVQVVEELGPSGSRLLHRVLDFSDDGTLDEVDTNEAVEVEFPAGLAGVSRAVEEPTEGDEVGVVLHRDVVGKPPEFAPADMEVVDLRPLGPESFKDVRRHGNRIQAPHGLPNCRIAVKQPCQLYKSC
jgi:hypothetical protein